MLVRNLIDLGGAVKKERDKRDWTQQELADLADVPREWIVRFENGQLPNPTFGRILKLFKALNMDLRVGPQTPTSEIDLERESDLAIEEPGFLRGTGR